MASTRLPGKALYPLGGTTVLGYLLHRLRRCDLVPRLVVATTTRGEDDPLARWAEVLADGCVRHAVPDDVLGRFRLATDELAGDDVVVRLTADNPLVCPDVVDACVGWVASGQYDYYRTSEHFPEGLDVEAFTVELLRSLTVLRLKPGEREHLAAPLAQWATRPGHHLLAEDYGRLRLTLDYPVDVGVVQKVAEALEWEPGGGTLRDILRLSRTKPTLFEANRDIQRNEWTKETQQ